MDGDYYGGQKSSLAKDYNQNASLFSSIIAKLANSDEILNGLRNSMDIEMKNVSDSKKKRDELDICLKNDLEKINHDLYDKLNRMLDELKNHSTNQRAEALKLQQEISILKKEKLDLYQRVTELQRRISDMEITIGQNV